MKTFRTSLIATLLLSFVALLAVGCGNSRDEFVVTNTNNASTGNLNFQFVQARTTTVPTTTTDLLFEFRNAANALVLTTTVPFSTSVTITGVPSDATRVNITALQNGFPVGSISDDVVVNILQTTDVDLSNATNTAITFDSLTATPNPIAFSGGGTQTLSVVATFSDTSSVTVPNSAVTFVPNDTNVANVSAAGVVSAAANTGGNTTIDASWTFNTVTQSTSIPVSSASIFFTDVPTQIQQGADVDVDTRFVGSDGNQISIDSQATYTFVPVVADVSIINNDNIFVAANVTADTTFQLQASFTDPLTSVVHTVTSAVITVTAAPLP